MLNRCCPPGFDTALRLNDVGAMVEQLGLEGRQRSWSTTCISRPAPWTKWSMFSTPCWRTTTRWFSQAVFRCPRPLTGRVKIGNPSSRTSQVLLGEHLGDDVRLDVAKALDGHPMALNLYQEGDLLPEAGADIQAFVEQTMLSGLDDAALGAMDGMVLFLDRFRPKSYLGRCHRRAG